MLPIYNNSNQNNSNPTGDSFSQVQGLIQLIEDVNQAVPLDGNHQELTRTRQILVDRQHQLESQLSQVSQEMAQQRIRYLSIDRLTLYMSRCLRGGNSNIELNRLTSGAKLSRIFHELFPLEMLRASKQMGAITLESLMNSQGVRGLLGSSEQAFDQLARHKINFLREPIAECQQLVVHELRLLIEESLDRMWSLVDSPDNISSGTIERADTVWWRQEVGTLLTKHLGQQERLLAKQTSMLIESELAYINKTELGQASFMLLDAALLSQSRTSLDSSASLTRNKRGWLQSFIGNNQSSSSSSSSGSNKSGGRNGKSSPNSTPPNSPPTRSFMSEQQANNSSDLSPNASGSLGATYERIYKQLTQLVNSYVNSVRINLTDLNVKCCTHFLVDSLISLVQSSNFAGRQLTGSELPSKLDIEHWREQASLCGQAICLLDQCLLEGPREWYHSSGNQLLQQQVIREEEEQDDDDDDQTTTTWDGLEF